LNISSKGERTFFPNRKESKKPCIDMHTARDSFTNEQKQSLQKPSYFKDKLVERESINCMKNIFLFAWLKFQSCCPTYDSQNIQLY